MSFPPISITSPFVLDTNSPLLLQEFSSLLPPLDQICSPFSRGRMNGYSRIRKDRTTRSKSIDFADLSFPHQSPSFFSTSLATKTNLNNAVKITRKPISIPEEVNAPGTREPAFGFILSQRCSIYSAQNAVAEQERLLSFQNVMNKSLSGKMVSSVSERYSRTPRHSDLAAQNDSQCGTKTTNRYVKKKAKLLTACRRFLRL